MGITSTTWKPGQSGNPKGKPPKHRELTEILQRAGAQTIEIDGKSVTGKRLVARMLWEIATTGQTKMPDGTPEGRLILAGPDAWFDIVKFIYAQVDGPPPQSVKLGNDPDSGAFIIAITERKDDRSLPAADEVPGLPG